MRDQLVIQPTGPIFVAIRNRSFIRERPLSVVASEVVMLNILKGSSSKVPFNKEVTAIYPA